MLEIKQKGTVLSADSKPYDIDGNKGISHKVRLLIGHEIFNLKTTESFVTLANSRRGKEVNVTISLTSPRELAKLELVGIE